MESGFSRQETLRLTGLSSHQLSYLDRTELVIPKKFGHPKHPSVIYTWEQILEIKTVTRLREELSPQEIRVAIDSLKNQDYDSSLFKMKLLFFNSKLYWIKDEESLKSKIIELIENCQGQILMHTADPIGDVVSELWTEAKKHHVLDFDKRARALALGVH
uniref:MerR family transcriptional regulator n=1 Tax=Trichocoleus desertorum TaxID=1481672 RepID=UPI0025B50B7B|nr:MerR family transcriptional regulator [Trichocoleus desertorum]